MNDEKICRIIILLVAIFISISSISGCTYSISKKEYYVVKENYIKATGIVRHIKYNDDKSALYLGFEDMSYSFDDNSFKIVGENLRVVQENGIDEKLEIGDVVEFVTAPKYFGDGYVMPIVGISVDDEALLEFEEGYNNFMDWLNE